MMKKLFFLFLATVMAGCGGINSASAPSDTFIVQVNYKDVYERAQEQAERCWRSEAEYPLTAQINEPNKTAVVFVTGLLGSTRMAELTARAVDEKSTEVKVVVNGISIWNRDAVKAMKEVVEFGVPTCTSYMPSKE